MTLLLSLLLHATLAIEPARPYDGVAATPAIDPAIATTAPPVAPATAPTPPVTPVKSDGAATAAAKPPGWRAPDYGLDTTAAPLDTTSAKFTPGKGVSLRSTDGRFVLNLSLRTGFQYTVQQPHDGAPLKQGLELRRLRTVFWADTRVPAPPPEQTKPRF